MKLNWLVCAAAAACMATPALAQTDTTVVVSGTSAGMARYTNVDMTDARGTMDDLRNHINRMQDNNNVAFAASDPVHIDIYRRMNVILLDNASAQALHLAEVLGPPTHIPPGLGATRSHISSVVNHLAHARMMADYGTPINQAKKALDMAYESLDRSNTAMSGSNMSGMGTSGSMSTTMGTDMNQPNTTSDQ